MAILHKKPINTSPARLQLLQYHASYNHAGIITHMINVTVVCMNTVAAILYYRKTCCIYQVYEQCCRYLHVHITDVSGTCNIQMDGAILEEAAQNQLLEELVHDVLEPGIVPHCIAKTFRFVRQYIQ